MSGEELAQASRGLWLRRSVCELACWSGITERVVEEITESVATLKGNEAAGILRQRGIERLHEVIEARDIGPLRDHVLEKLRQPLLAIAVSIAREFLGWDADFYVDDYLILRVNLPYEVARSADASAENPGIGRLTPRVRALAMARRKLDPVYNPAGYHRGHPPAAWAHGPHVDSWAGHSKTGRNIWWAISDVSAEAGMVYYPELALKTLPLDPRTLCLQAGYPLPKPTCLPLRAGELLVFDPEVLHGTHLNTTDTTRVAITMRLDASKPAFAPECFYAFEFWRRAADIETNKDEILHFPREDNLAAPAAEKPSQPRRSLPIIQGTLDTASQSIRAVFAKEIVSKKRIIVEAPPYRVMVVRTEAGLEAYDAFCPHYGIDLGDGESDDNRTYCPACGVGFDIHTGRSSCPSLSLRRYELWEADGAVLIRVGP